MVIMSCCQINLLIGSLSSSSDLGLNLNAASESGNYVSGSGIYDKNDSDLGTSSFVDKKANQIDTQK